MSLRLLTFFLFFIFSASYVSAAPGDSISDDEVRIGILTDMSGPYSDIQGPGVVAAAEMAISDFGGTVLGKNITLTVADNDNDPDHSSTIARKWIDTKNIDLITGLGASSVALAIQSLAADKEVLVIATGSGSTELTGAQCSRTGIRYTYSTRALAVGTAKAIIAQGGKKWFFLGVDYAFGKAMVKDASEIINASGGTVIDSVYYPLGTTDFASYVLQAQQSGADVIALANAGLDFVNSARSFQEFGVTSAGNQRVVGMLVVNTDIYALGTDLATGLQFTVPWYINRNADARSWSERFHEKTGTLPNWNNAGIYSAITTYLKAVEKAGTDNAASVREALGSITINDMFVTDGHIRADGTMIHDMYLVEVNAPSSASGDKPSIDLLDTISGADSFGPIQDCDL